MAGAGTRLHPFGSSLRLAVFLIAALLVLGCSSPKDKSRANSTRMPDIVNATADAAGATATAGFTPEHTLTPTPAATASATPAPSETPTPTPSPSPTPAPSPPSTVTPPAAPAPVQTLADGTHGYVVTSAAVVQAEPNTRSSVVARLSFQQELKLSAKVTGEKVVVGEQDWYIAYQDWQSSWYKVDNGYVYAAYVWLPKPGEVLPSGLGRGERWVDVNLATQTAHAMVGDTVVYTAPVTTGKDGFETPTGHWRVNYQVPNETMTSAQAGINNPAEKYDVRNVLFTQYFDGFGDALHLNYWQPAGVFGSTPTSHGCVGLYLRDAQYLWMFGQPGMRVEINVNGRIVPPTNSANAAQASGVTPAPAPVRTVAPAATTTVRPSPTRAPTAAPTPDPTPLRPAAVVRTPSAATPTILDEAPAATDILATPQTLETAATGPAAAGEATATISNSVQSRTGATSNAAASVTATQVAPLTATAPVSVPTPSR